MTTNQATARQRMTDRLAALTDDAIKGAMTVLAAKAGRLSTDERTVWTSLYCALEARIGDDATLAFAEEIGA